MLVGLLFAIDEAEDRPNTLAATLPFGAATLIEYQARLLQACGAHQLIVVVQRLTPELTGAVARLGHRGLTVDVARGAADVLARLHPLAQVVMLGDALVTTEGVVRLIAEGDRDALLVSPDGTAPGAAFERLGGGMLWGGVARLAQARVADAAALPADYDLQSTLLRVAEQAGARHVTLAEGERLLGHGIERRGVALEERGRAMLAGTLALRSSWFERYLVRPVARRVIPLLARRMTSSATVAGAGGAVAAGGLIAVGAGFPRVGSAAVLGAVMAFEIAGALALFRDEAAVVRTTRWGIAGAALAIVAILGWRLGGVASPLLAVGAIVAGVIGERASGAAARRLWWGTPGGYLALIVAALLAGQGVAALALAAAYAVATLTAAVETLRRQT